METIKEIIAELTRKKDAAQELVKKYNKMITEALLKSKMPLGGDLIGKIVDVDGTGSLFIRLENFRKVDDGIKLTGDSVEVIDEFVRVLDNDSITIGENEVNKMKIVDIETVKAAAQKAYINIDKALEKF